MRRQRIMVGISAGLVVMAMALPAHAHHAFAGEFDANKPLELKGTVVRMEWVNPHSWIHMDVKTKDGKTERWMVEGGPPTSLLRRGFTKDSLKPGVAISVAGFQAKDGSHHANGRDLTLADGTKLFLGSSGTGAPKDGKDPNEK